MSDRSIEDKIRALPPNLQKEAEQYIEDLVKRSKKRSFGQFMCGAEGSLEELGSHYSSVDLQHKASEWWNE